MDFGLPPELRLLNYYTALSHGTLMILPLPATRDEEEEDDDKPAPPPATPVHFPSYQPRELLPINYPVTVDLRTIFSQLVAWSQLQPRHVESIKLQLINEVSLENVIPGLAAFTPPSEWKHGLGANPLQVAHPARVDEASCTNELNDDSTILMSNGKPTPTRRDFHLRAQELSMGNKKAYKESKVRRGPRGNAQIVIYAQFYAHLKQVGEYWDTSLDPPEATLVKLRLKQAQEEAAKDHMVIDQDLEGFSYSPASEQDDPMESSIPSQTQHGEAEANISPSQASQPQKASSKRSSAMSSTPDAQPGHNADANDLAQSRAIEDLSTEKPSVEHNPSTPSHSLAQAHQNLLASLHGPITFSPGEAQEYKGLRTSTGSAMPLSTLVTTVLDFLNPVLYHFGCGSYAPSDVSVHRLSIRHLLLPIESISIYRIPTSRDAIRQRLREGPLLAVSVREIDHETPTERKDIADAMKEVLAILTLAEERSREGREEVRVRKEGWLGDREKLRGVVKAGEAEIGGRWNHWHGGWRTVGLPKGVDVCVQCGVKRPEPLAEGSNILGPAPRWGRKVVYGRVGKEEGKEWEDVSFAPTVTFLRNPCSFPFHLRPLLSSFVQPLSIIDFPKFPSLRSHANVSRFLDHPHLRYRPSHLLRARSRASRLPRLS